MQGRLTHMPWYAAAVAVFAATALAGCAATPGASAKATKLSPPPMTALDAVHLAAKTAEQASTYTGTLSIKITTKPGASIGSTGAADVTGTIAAELRPKVLEKADFSQFRLSGAPVTGGLSEVITPTTLYIKWPYLNQALHDSKPWLSFPLSALGQSSGVNVGQVMSQEMDNGPLAQSRMLAAAKDVHRAGTGTVGGVSVTKYTGVIPLDKATQYLPAAARSQLAESYAANGFTDAKFTDWIDANHVVRKATVTIDGTTVSETITVTMTSLNKPVNITPPPAGETTSVPASALGG